MVWTSQALQSLWIFGLVASLSRGVFLTGALWGTALGECLATPLASLGFLGMTEPQYPTSSWPLDVATQLCQESHEGSKEM